MANCEMCREDEAWCGRLASATGKSSLLFGRMAREDAEAWPRLG